MMERPRKSHSPSRFNALSPLQAFSPLSSVDSDLPTTQSPTKIPASGLSRSGSSKRYGNLQRSFSGRERAFSTDPRRRESMSSENARDVTTRLILVKAPPEKDGTLRQRSKSSSSLAPFSAFAASLDSPATSNHGPRRSFAAASFSSFAPLSPLSHNRPASGDFSGLVKADKDMQSSPERSKTLSPEQVVDLARSLMSPVVAPEPGSSAARKLQRQKSSGSLRMSAMDPEPATLEPVDYKEMEADVLLPFSTRPKEVEELLTNPLNSTLYLLLQVTFPKGPKRPEWKDTDVRKWNWPEFWAHLTEIDRRECPDYPWVLLARDAVRQHSVSLWEKLGFCLGCDPELMMAGDEEDTPASWGGLALGEEGEYDPTLSRVYIEGLAGIDPAAAAEEAERAERELSEAFDDDEHGAAGGFSNMATIGESEEYARSGPTAAQRAGSGHAVDTFPSPDGGSALQLGSSLASSYSSMDSSAPASPPQSQSRPERSKSFVGLQIATISSSGPSPTQSSQNLRSRSNSAVFSLSPTTPQYDRGPGNPLFPSSFNTLSLAPNLGRKASVGAYGHPSMPSAHTYTTEIGDPQRWRNVGRKASATGLSESAITFVSDSSLEGMLVSPKAAQRGLDWD